MVARRFSTSSSSSGGTCPRTRISYDRAATCVPSIQPEGFSFAARPGAAHHPDRIYIPSAIDYPAARSANLPSSAFVRLYSWCRDRQRSRRDQRVGGQVGSPTGGHTGWGLLGTKVVPPAIPRGYLRRRRLEKLLDDGVSGPLTLVSAGPGWGKTLVVASWIREQLFAQQQAGREPPAAPSRRAGQFASVAWLTLDIDDNELRIFWTGVLTALRQAGALPPDSELATLALAPGVTAKGLQRLRDGLAGLRPGTVLVLDDLHVVRNPEVLESIAVLLRHELALRLVLISRTDPVLPLHRLRVNGGLQEIRALDLAFDEDEATGLFRMTGQQVDPEDVARLVERTEGWAAGLRLAGMFLSRHDSPGRADEFAGDDRAVAEYLLGEVFGSQPADMRTFLLRTSVTDRICGDRSRWCGAGR